MKRKTTEAGGLKGRVLARALAEDLRKVGAGSAILTSVATEPNPRPDITNGTSDNDGPITY